MTHEQFAPRIIYETYSMDYSGIINWAKRDDGVLFRRSMYKDHRYGYKWTSWQQRDTGPDNASETYMSRKARLPKAA